MENKKRLVKYVPIGFVTNYDGIKLKVVETPYNKAECTGCYFSDWERHKRGLAKFSCYAHKMLCTSHLRKDKKHVIFIEKN